MPEFRPVLTEVYREGEKLALKLLEFIGCALKPEVDRGLEGLKYRATKGVMWGLWPPCPLPFLTIQ